MINHHQHRRPTDYTERAYRHRRTVTSSSRHRPRHDLHRQGHTIALFKLVSITPTYFDSSADIEAATSLLTYSVTLSGPGASPSLHQPTLENSAASADQLHHVSWTGGFASASQPLPTSPCRCFIAHRAMGVQIDSQFWESLFFGLLQQINQVLLIPSIFACLGLFFPRNYYSGLFHHLYTGLSNGGRINDGRMVVRSVSVHSSANAASRTRTDL